MKNKLGSNQHCTKVKYNFWASVWFILLLVAVYWIYTLMNPPKIISPISDTPFIPRIYAKEPELTLREKVLIQVIRTFGVEQVAAFDKLIEKESSWNPKAINPESGASGLFQILPLQKSGCKLEDIDCQVSWVLKYILERYGNPTRAFRFHLMNNYY